MTLQELLSKASVKAAELNPFLREKCMQLVELAYKNGYSILVTQGYRSIAEQNSLYAQGRNGDTRPIVTNAKGGESNHNYRLAFDIAVLNSDGSIDWNTESKYKAIGKLGQSIQLDWGGVWTGFVDLPHFEYTYGLTVAQLQKGAKIPDYPAGYQPVNNIEVIKVTKPVIVKERVYAVNGVLKRCDGDYKTAATDVRYLKLDKNTYTMKLVWAKNKKVSELVKEYGADYGINFPFFWDGNPVADCKIGNTILNQGYDTPNGAKQTAWHGFGYKNGQPVIGELSINDNYGADGFLVKTTPLLLNGKGEQVWDWYRVQEGTASDIGKDASGYVRAQRTVVGLDDSGNLHIAVGDGRTKYDRGLDLQEMALYMLSKGCVSALNGDGGSSSVIADSTGSLGQNVGAEERAVNHAVLIFLNKEVPTSPTDTNQGENAAMEQWKIDMGLNALQALQAYKQPNGEPIVDINSWKDKLGESVPVWAYMELLRRAIEAKKV